MGDAAPLDLDRFTNHYRRHWAPGMLISPLELSNLADACEEIGAAKQITTTVPPGSKDTLLADVAILMLAVAYEGSRNHYMASTTAVDVWDGQESRPFVPYGSAEEGPLAASAVKNLVSRLGPEEYQVVDGHIGILLNTPCSQPLKPEHAEALEKTSLAQAGVSQNFLWHVRLNKDRIARWLGGCCDSAPQLPEAETSKFLVLSEVPPAPPADAPELRMTSFDGFSLTGPMGGSAPVAPASGKSKSSKPSTAK